MDKCKKCRLYARCIAVARDQAVEEEAAGNDVEGDGGLDGDVVEEPPQDELDLEHRQAVEEDGSSTNEEDGSEDGSEDISRSEDSRSSGWSSDGYNSDAPAPSSRYWSAWLRSCALNRQRYRESPLLPPLECIYLEEEDL